MDAVGGNTDPGSIEEEITYQLVPFLEDEVFCNLNIKQEPPDYIENDVEESEEITIKQEYFGSEDDEYDTPNEKKDCTEENGMHDSRESTLTHPTTMPCMAIIKPSLKEKRFVSSKNTNKGGKNSLVDSDGKTFKTGQFVREGKHFCSDTVAVNADFDGTQLSKQEFSNDDIEREIGLNERSSRENLHGLNERSSRENLQKITNIGSSIKNTKNSLAAMLKDNQSQVIPKQYVCHICGKSYKHATNRIRHMRSHAQHKCELCRKSFIHKDDLDKHKLYHVLGKQQLHNVRKHSFRAVKDVVKSFNPQLKSLGKSSSLVRLQKRKIFNKTQKLESTSKMTSSSHVNVPKLNKLKTAIAHRQSFPCHLCGKSFSWHYLLKRHKQTHLPKRSVLINQKVVVKDWSCITCKKTFSTKYHLIRHEGTEGHKEQLKLVQPSKYPCNLCNKIFPSLSNLNRHRETLVHKLNVKGKVRETPDQKYSCDTCGKVFASLQILKKHELTHISSDNKEKKMKGILYTCQVCKKSFSWLSEVRKHLISAAHVSNVNHAKNVGVEDDKAGCTCNVCGKIFSHQKTLRAHQHSSGHGPQGQSFACGICGRKFFREVDLRKHQTVTNHIPKFKTEPQETSAVVHSCDKCGKTFPWSYQLNNHKISHMPKKYPCNICNRYFAAEYLLKKHKIVHTKRLTNFNSKKLPHVKVTVCTCNICGEKFAQLSRLRKHKTVCHRSPKMFHSGNKDSNTNIYLNADKKFPLLIELLGKDLLTTAAEVEKKANVKLVHACIICNRTFSRLRDLQSHRAKTGHIAVEPKQENTKTNASNENSFSCDVCGKTLSRFSDLSRHKAMAGHNSKKHQNLHTKSENTYDIIYTKSPLPVLGEQQKLIPTSTVKENGFSCDVCGKTLSRFSDLSRHKAMAGHNCQKYQNPYTKSETVNDITEAKSPLPVSAEQQKLISTSTVRENGFSCDVCGRTLSRLSDLSRHKAMAGHYPQMFQNAYIKSENTNDFETKSPLPNSGEHCKLALTSTVKGTENTKAHPCNTCSRRFSRQCDLTRHRIKSGHSFQPETKAEKAMNKNLQAHYSCGTCSKKFSRQNDLRRHVAVTGHAYEALISDKGTPNKTEHFSSNTFVRALSHPCLNTHEQPANNVPVASNLQESSNAYPCHICDKTFPWLYQLRNHKCHGSAKKYSCKMCDKHFSQEYLLKRHKLLHASHSAQGAYTCNTCHRVFSRLSDLNRHTNVSDHVGSKSEPKFYCQFCNKFFWRLCDLKRHENKFSHHSYALNVREKKLNHLTNLARKKVPQQNNVIKHSSVVGHASNTSVAKQKANSKSMHQCKICNRRYSWKSGLNRHQTNTGHV